MVAEETNPAANLQVNSARADLVKAGLVAEVMNAAEIREQNRRVVIVVIPPDANWIASRCPSLMTQG